MHSGKDTYTIQVCFSPISWPLYQRDDALVIVVDIFRATTTISAALESGAKAVMPVESIDESKEWKAKGYFTAGERNGKPLDFADTGNSPLAIQQAGITNKTIVLNTTNGTRAIQCAANGNNTVITGAFPNISAVARFAVNTKKPVIVLCAGWKDTFSLEDSVFAGAVARHILDLDSTQFYTDCDSTMAAMALWETAKHDLPAFLKSASHNQRLQGLGVEKDIAYALTRDVSDIVPVLEDNRLVSNINL